MTKPRGRPARGDGITRDRILDTALALLEEHGGRGVSMRALASRLGVTPMSLYHHVDDHAGLLRALSDRIYGAVLDDAETADDPLVRIRTILLRYHGAVKDYPQLTLSIFAEPAAFAGVTRTITDRLVALLENLTPEPLLWLDILIDHAHGNALAFQAPPASVERSETMLERYRQALDLLLARLLTAPAAAPPACPDCA